MPSFVLLNQNTTQIISVTKMKNIYNVYLFIIVALNVHVNVHSLIKYSVFLDFEKVHIVRYYFAIEQTELM